MAGRAGALEDGARRTSAHGDVIIVRHADDFIVGFQYWADAEGFLIELRERLAKFKLELHPEKTRELSHRSIEPTITPRDHNS